MLCDTTYKDDHTISNELRHLFWFPKKTISKGDFVKLMTKNGTASTFVNRSATTTHVFYWNLGKTVWNKDGDAAILLNLAQWKTTRA